MIGIKKFLPAVVFFNVCIAALVCAACSYPIGSLMADPSLGVPETKIEVEVSKQQYYVGETFKPAEDFKLFEINGSGRAHIDVLESDGVVITIIGDGDPVTISGKDKKQKGHVFISAKPDKKSVGVSLYGMKTSYIILVEEKTGGSEQGIGITWI
jgi:hypothetical protein